MQTSNTRIDKNALHTVINFWCETQSKVHANAFGFKVKLKTLKKVLTLSQHRVH